MILNKNPFKTKKGQGLSLNVIIVAALALIVLVVLIMVFTGRITIFQDEVNQAGQAEIVKLRITYGQCEPTPTEEANFMTNFGAAKEVGEKATLRATYKEEIGRCKALSNSEDECTQQGCWWD